MNEVRILIPNNKYLKANILGKDVSTSFKQRKFITGTVVKVKVSCKCTHNDG